MKSFPLVIACLLLLNSITAQTPSRWQLSNDGGIVWKVKEGDSHLDNIEMSGFYISTIVQYGVEKGKRYQKLHLVFPMLRTIPNDTHASLSYDVDQTRLEAITVQGKPVEEYPEEFHLKGVLQYQSRTNDGLEIQHQLFPSTDQAVFLEKITVKNTTTKPISLELPNINISDTTDAAKGVAGAYVLQVLSNKSGPVELKASESLTYAILYSGRSIHTDPWYVSVDYTLKKREALVQSTFTNLAFESPDSVLNRAFAFAKLRAVESIYQTKGGLMHGPGGGRYYAAIWANDQAEYANPFFPFLGNDAGNESAINAFRHFGRFTNPDYKPIPSSIVAEGLDYWNGAGDRGDMAMIAYGASRFAMAYGDRKTAQDLWSLIEWCLEYCHRKLNADGVVSSDCDELENRFPAGDANLNTSSLYYDALRSAHLLGRELGKDPVLLNQYLEQSKVLKQHIETFFGANMDGFDTYRYYKGNDKLRAWICTPLTVGIFDRKKGTIDALFSEKLWTKDGLASASGSATFWDRATLYGLRGVFAAGETQKAMDFFTYYSNRRLVGEHVPYAVEAYPEGNQRHLSAESALYCRVVTEGIWGIRPEVLASFSFTPRLPDGWNAMALRNIRAFNHCFDLEVKREKNRLRVKVFSGKKVLLNRVFVNGETLKVSLL